LDTPGINIETQTSTLTIHTTMFKALLLPWLDSVALTDTSRTNARTPNHGIRTPMQPAGVHRPWVEQAYGNHTLPAVRELSRF